MRPPVQRDHAIGFAVQRIPLPRLTAPGRSPFKELRRAIPVLFGSITRFAVQQRRRSAAANS
jgi:hypothetical protein